jgi:hypothetical protein
LLFDKEHKREEEEAFRSLQTLKRTFLLRRELLFFLYMEVLEGKYFLGGVEM